METQISISSFSYSFPQGDDPPDFSSPEEISPVNEGQLHIGILVEGRYLLEAQPLGVAAELKARGHLVTVIVPGPHVHRTRDMGRLDGMDLIISRGRSAGILSLLHLAEAQGIATANRRASIGSVNNKAEMAMTLAAAGVPTPYAYAGPVRELARRIPAGDYPVILKPVIGDDRDRMLVVHSALELARIPWPEPSALAQRYLPGSGFDLELYVIGQDVWALRKRSSLAAAPAPEGGSTAVGGEALRVSPASEMEELALTCGGLFGLDYYRLDCVETPRGPVVVDVKEFPNYSGVAGADERLADFALRRAYRRKR
jgi:ribosomal protein S6--L-glutamate ligase